MKDFLIKLTLNNGKVIKFKATEHEINALADGIQASKEYKDINFILEFEGKKINASDIKKYRYIEAI